MRRFAVCLCLLLLTGCASTEKPPAPAPVTVPPVTAPTERPPTEQPPIKQPPIEQPTGEEPPTVEQLMQTGAKVGEADAVALYRWTRAGAKDEYWAVVDGQAVRFPVDLEQIDQMQLFSTLSDGGRVFVLRGGEAPVYVAAARAYYFVRLRDGEAKPIRFTGDWQQFHQTMPSERMLYSSVDPVLNGTEVQTRHRNPASGKTTINLTWQIDWAQGVGTLAKLEEDLRDPNK